jgi:uncharacterized repeat protein (TIGR02543 family)
MYAQWTVTRYTVTFDSHGGSDVPAITQNTGTQVTKPVDPTLADHTFTGWFSAASGGTEYNWPHTLNGDVTMHAHWTENSTPPTDTVDMGDNTNIRLFQKADSEWTAVDASYEDTLDDAFDYIWDNAESDDEYMVLLGADQDIKSFYPPQNDTRTGIKVTLRGHGEERKIGWDGTSKQTYNPGVGDGGLFIINNENSLILDSNITLDGKNTVMYCRSGQDTATSNQGGASNSGKAFMVAVGSGTLKMLDGSKIVRMGRSGGNNVGPGGVFVNTTGYFILDGGELSENDNNSLFVESKGNFHFISGAIKKTGSGLMGNGVTLKGGSFVMDGGEISGDANNITGRGIYVNCDNTGCPATINGGTIKNFQYGVSTESYGTVTLENGTIDSCSIGIETKTTFIINGGDITNTENPIKMYGRLAALVLNASVNITSPLYIYFYNNANGTIYLGNNFSTTSNISINIGTNSSANFKKADYWAGTGKAFLKGGTPEKPTAITQSQLDKFTAGIGGYGTSCTEITGGNVVLYLGEDNFGYAKWEADE